eukprot:GHVT01069637.1.p2 GENE.GHVT01069637.1~~GHVT01069637.1.p2  ORF type:complete len:127 (-),score=4.28 GHVT01069637.1:1491-1871(-)
MSHIPSQPLRDRISKGGLWVLKPLQCIVKPHYHCSMGQKGAFPTRVLLVLLLVPNFVAFRNLFNGSSADSDTAAATTYSGTNFELTLNYGRISVPLTDVRQLLRTSFTFAATTKPTRRTFDANIVA